MYLYCILEFPMRTIQLAKTMKPFPPFFSSFGGLHSLTL